MTRVPQPALAKKPRPASGTAVVLSDPMSDPMCTPPDPLRDEDRASVEAAHAWVAQRRKTHNAPPYYWRAPGKNGALGRIEPFHCDRWGHQDQMLHALGTMSEGFVDRIVNQLRNAPGVTDETAVAAINDGLSFIASNKPQSEMETTVLVSYWFSYLFGIRQLQAAGSAPTIDHMNAHGLLAAKVSNLAIKHLEALAKLRGGGKQEVVVTHVHQHVHIAEGGQAVIGQVPGGGGGDLQIEHQSHGTVAGLAFAPGAALWSEDPQGEPVPIARDEGQGAVQNPRRQGRRAQG